MRCLDRSAAGSVAAACLVVGLGACEDDPLRSQLPKDIDPPTAVRDLVVVAVSDSTATVQWTAAGDGGNGAPVASHELRFAAQPFGSHEWDGATSAALPTPPATPGAVERFTLQGLDPDTTWWFRMRTRDAAGNWSPLSNAASAQTWADGDSLPTVRDLLDEYFSPTVEALAVVQGRLIAGGYVASSQFPANHLLEWDGHGWNAVGGEIQGEVQAMTMHRAALVVMGWITQIGETAVPGVAQWDGDVWTPIGGGILADGLHGNPRALASYGGRLIAGGFFVPPNDAEPVHCMAWDGAGWAALDEDVDGQITAMVVLGPDLIAVGSFAKAGSVEALHAARWDGVGWSALGEGLPAISPLCAAVCGGTLFVGGYPADGAGAGRPAYARWTGSNWELSELDRVAAVEAIGCYTERAVLGIVETLPGLGFKEKTLGLAYRGGWTPLGPARTGGASAIVTFAGEVVVGGWNLFY